MVTFHMTKLINQHAGTQVQRRRAAAHHLFRHLRGTNTWAPIAGTPEARRAPLSRCAKVDDIRISHPLCHRTPREREEEEEGEEGKEEGFGASEAAAKEESAS